MFALSIGPRTGTHQRIDTWAALSEAWFPDIEHILIYEGMGPKAPDGSAIIYHSNVTDTAAHYYNPVTSEGGAIQRACRYWQTLVHELDRPYHARSARAAAWMAHFVTDALSPAHHIGNYVPPPPGLPAGKRYRNWYDPYWDAYPFWQRLAGIHATFELQVVLHTPAMYQPTLTRYPEFDQVSELHALLHSYANRIAGSGLYSRYIAHGWTADVEELCLEMLLPVQSSLVACAWRSALQEANRRNRRNDRVTMDAEQS